MSWRKRFAYACLALILGFTIGLAALGFSPVLAALCPKCFGFEKLSTTAAHPAQHRIYIEAGHEEEAQTLAAHYIAGAARVSAALGPLEKHPIILSCVTARCTTLMGGHKALAITYGTALVYLGPRARAPHIITHELSHVALHRKLGFKALGDFPAWVDEGIATYISQDRRFDLNARSCEPPKAALPVSAKVWRRAAGQNQGRDSWKYYGPAGCVVAQWAAANPNLTLNDLIDQHRASAGESAGEP